MGQYARVSTFTVQTLQQSESSGSTAGVTSLTAQALISSTPARVQVSNLAAQTLTSTTPKRTQIASLMAQLLIQNLASTGGTFRNTENTGQVLYSIGVDDTPRQRAWTFDFDGHTFYVLDLGTSGALVYDLTTQSWSKWTTPGYEGHFNFKNGFHWRDGKQVIGGGLLDGLLVALDEDSFLDEDFRPVTYEVRGVIFASAERFIRQYNLRLIGSPGRTGLVDTEAPPTLNMQYSDDNGATWSTARTVTLSLTDNNQRIEFRSLGAFRQPGRIFRLYDSGGIKFLAYVMADVEGEQ